MAGTASVLFCRVLCSVDHRFNCFLFHAVGFSYGTFGKRRGKKRDAFTGGFLVWHTQQEKAKQAQLFTSGSSLIS